MMEFVIADSGIRQLHARFIDAVWRKDIAAFADCFAEHAEWKIAGMHMRGRADIAATASRLLGACERILITASTPVLEVQDGIARGRLHCLEFAKLIAGGSAMTIGVYHDRYVEEKQQWRFEWRHWAVHYRGPADLSVPFIQSPDYGPFPNTPGPDEPTFARKA